MSKLFKILILTLALGMGFWLALSSVWVGRAAPTALPACGHNPVFTSPDLVSGPPDIAVSQDAAETYTAIVWSGGQHQTSDRGDIKLAYSKVQTTTRSWTRFTVDDDTDDARRGKDPSIVFDPDGSDTVHIAYRKGQGIYYQKCDLESSTCSITQDITFSDNAGTLVTHDVPQITVMADTNTVVIVYFENDQSQGTKFLRYATIPSSGQGTPVKNIILTNNDHSTGLNGVQEENPTAVYAADKVHIAYAKIPNNGSASIEYGNLGALGGQVTNVKQFALSTPATEPNFPAIDARNNKVILVWEVKDQNNGLYSLVYNTSNDNGQNWDNSGIMDYRYLFTDNNNGATGKAEWATAAPGVPFEGGLQADVAIDDDGMYHVVWQAKDGSTRHDILYTNGVFAVPPASSPWIGNDNINTTPVSYTNVTDIYRMAEFSPLTASKVKPKIHFGQPGGRMQVVYMSAQESPSTGWDIFYNGWQLGQGEDPPFNFVDSDCDWISDSDEQNATNCPEADDPNDCDGDGIPNHMDNDSDGDGADDYFEDQAGTDPNDPTSTPPTVYLPLIFKS